MKGIIAILLLSMLVDTGYFCLDQILIFHAKWNASCLFQPGRRAVTIIKLTVSKINFDKPEGDELVINGNLYDVVKRTVVGDSIAFLLYPDEEEQAAQSDLGEHFSPNQPSLIKNVNRIEQIKNPHLIRDKIQLSSPRPLIHCEESICSITLLPALNNISTRHRPVPTPPPRVVMNG